jgi:hypothetical protein
LKIAVLAEGDERFFLEKDMHRFYNAANASSGERGID